jgi:hypothetical protein
MNPIRKTCIDEAVKIWLDQPSLGILETANEIRVNIRGSRAHNFKDVPGAEAIRQWLAEEIANGHITGPFEGKQRKAGKQRL